MMKIVTAWVAIEHSMKLPFGQALSKKKKNPFGN
jgi:hypothetical protein